MAPSDVPPFFSRSKTLAQHQPLKAIIDALYTALGIATMPFWMIYFLLPSHRQRPDWSWSKAFIVQCFVRGRLAAAASKRPEQTARPYPGSSSGVAELFEAIPPVSADMLVGVASAARTSVRAEVRPGSWYPARYDSTRDAGSKVLMFFSGAAFVLGAHIADSFKPTLDQLLPELGNAKFFGCGVRLTSSRGNHFPAQLIDALSAYSHLLGKGIPSSDVILAGSSAGAHIVLSLLRYLGDHPELNLHHPAAAILLCPWVDLSIPTSFYARHPKYYSDSITKEILQWGIDTFVPGNMSTQNPYISPGLHGFRTRVPLFIQVDNGEYLYKSTVEFARLMEEVKGNRIRLYVSSAGTHAWYMYAFLAGFDADARDLTRSLKEFLVKESVFDQRPRSQRIDRNVTQLGWTICA